MKYAIKRVVPVEIGEPVQQFEEVQVKVAGVKEMLLRPVTRLEPKTVNTFEDAGEFEELPAPEVTLGGYLLALKNETGFDHVAVERVETA